MPRISHSVRMDFGEGAAAIALLDAEKLNAANHEHDLLKAAYMAGARDVVLSMFPVDGVYRGAARAYSLSPEELADRLVRAYDPADLSEDAAEASRELARRALELAGEGKEAGHE